MPRSSRADADATPVTPRLLARYPLPSPDDAEDKEGRGRVLVVGGARQMPGAVILAATAALRAGAGKLQIATAKSIAPVVGAAVPEAYVVALPEEPSGALSLAGVRAIASQAREADAVLLGPGMVDDAAAGRFATRLVRALDGADASFVLDAAPLACIARNREALVALRGRAVVTPHAGEMAMMLGCAKSDVTRAPLAIACRTADEMRVVVALKGKATYIAAPGGTCFVNRAGNVGLATSGSGDTLSGIVTGLAARGAGALEASMWGVHAHACAGDVLARTMAPVGFLARELLDEIPRVLARLTRGSRATRART